MADHTPSNLTPSNLTPSNLTPGNDHPPISDHVDPRGQQVFQHLPVLAAAVVDGFRDRRSSSAIVVDATVGLGGHTQVLLDAFDWVQVVGLDRDRQALERTRVRLERYGQRVRLVHGTMSNLTETVSPVTAVAGVLADLGVSSMQLDDPARGFSFRFDAALDMRMDQSNEEMTVVRLLESSTVDDLIGLFRQHGVGSLSRRYATAIKDALPVTTTGGLAAVIVEATPAKLRGGRIHPATKVFQALRVSVNDEIDELIQFLPAAFALLDVGGVLQVISYHSGEDRLVKRFMRHVETGGCLCPPRLGCTCGATPAGERIQRHAINPSEAEATLNPRSRSAHLRSLRRSARDVNDVIDRYWHQVTTWHE